MKLEFLGKFYDNHSLSIVNRNIVLALYAKGIKTKIIALDSYSPSFLLNKKDVKILKELELLEQDVPDIQVRHTYPPVWIWPNDKRTKIVYIQPWEFPKAPFEWQYKFETFADALVVPSNFTASVFNRGGIDPEKLFVVPNGYNTNIFNHNKEDNSKALALGIDPNKFNFVFVGNSQWRKGLDLVLNAWYSIFAKSDTARLIIKDNPRVYGKSNILNEIIKMQYKTGCAEIIYIDDELSESDMAAIYKASKVLVHPYRAEGFAMHVQEAVACGCIPVVSANGPTDDFIPSDKSFKIQVAPKAININDPNIFALKPGDSTSLMSTHTFVNEPSVEHLKKILQYLYHSHDKTKFFEAVKSIDTLYTWESVANTYIDVFTTIASKTTAAERIRLL
jgi:glycosyltransferase involved in cell wall biosynthesis